MHCNYHNQREKVPVKNSAVLFFSVFRVVEYHIFNILLSRMYALICLSVVILLNTLCWRLLCKKGPVVVNMKTVL